MSEWFGDFTIFNSELATQGQVISLTFSGLIELLREPKVCESKRGTKAFLPGRLKPDGTRRKDDVDDLCALCVDFDHGGKPNQYTDLWEQHAHIVVSTFSHTNDNPRFRAIFPLARPVKAADWPSFYRHASTMLSRGEADTATVDASRIWYLPSCPMEHLDKRIFTVSEGVLLDPSVFAGAPKIDGRFTKPSEALEKSMSWREILEPHGWTFVRSAGNSEFWARPGKPRSDGHSAVVHVGESGVLYNFSSSADPLEPNRAYSKFALFATLNHGGNFKTAAKAIREKHPVASTPGGTETKTEKSATASSVLAEAVTELVTDYLNGQDGEQYVRVVEGGVARHMSIGSQKFGDVLALAYHHRTGSYCAADAMERARSHCAALARRKPKVPAWTRIGVEGSEVIWDLGGDPPRYVRMTAEGWSIESDAGLLMARPTGMKQLPDPVRGGSINELREVVNCPDDHTWVLLCACLVGVFFPDTPLPLILITGEQGSGKSGLARRIKELVDPCAINLARPPKDDRDWQAHIVNNYLLALDNLSKISAEQSDTMCSLSTEGTFANRKLYTNSELSFVNARRPVVITSIDKVVERADLASRAVFLKLPPLVGTYLTEQELNARFELALPRIMGAMCDAVSACLQSRGCVTVDRDVRMIDFLRNAVAAEQCFGFPEGATLNAYRAMQSESNADAIESDFLASAIVTLAAECDGDELTAKEILKRAKAVIDDESVRLPAANQLHKWIDRLSPVLRQSGVELVRLPRRGEKRPYVIRKIDSGVSPRELDNDGTRDDDVVEKEVVSCIPESGDDDGDGMTAGGPNSSWGAETNASAAAMFKR